MRGRPRQQHDRRSALPPHVATFLLFRAPAPQQGPLTEEAIEAGGYAAVLLVDETVGFQLRANEACRRAGTAFISASSRGAFASLFCDFGDSFVVQDTDGEEALVRFTPPEGTPRRDCGTFRGGCAMKRTERLQILVGPLARCVVMVKVSTHSISILAAHKRQEGNEGTKHEQT